MPLDGTSAVGTPVQSSAPTPSGTPSKPPQAQENIKPESSSGSSKSTDALQAAKTTSTSESSKPPAGATPTAFTLAMRGIGEEAAQKAKDQKKKATEAILEKWQAEAAAKKHNTDQEAEEPASIPSPITPHKDVSTTSKQDTSVSMQSPNTTAWKNTPATSETQYAQTHPFIEPMQSPSSTAWKSTDVDPPITTHRGSTVSIAPPEEIKKIEQSQAIKEEDEEDEEDEEADEGDDDNEEEEDEEEDNDDDENKGDEDDADEDDDEDSEEDSEEEEQGGKKDGKNEVEEEGEEAKK